jgi:hypothetical protein
MSHQIYLLALRGDVQDDDDVRDDMARLVHRVGGFVLMATGSGALITAFDEQWAPLFHRHAAIQACGALRLDPQGAAASKLRHLFAVNVAAQLAARADPDAGMPASGATHRPLVWHQPAAAQPDRATGVRISTQPVTR